ncbi:MAG: YhjD/YihY/BrkB family envelope integrity protein [Planctomycetota bacterium]|jgi:membrane protein
MLKLKEVLSTQYAELGKASRFLVFQIKLWSHCARLLKKNRAGQQAAALSYHTIFGVVPLAIVMLLIFQSFPAYSDIGDKVKDLIYEGLNVTTIEISTADAEGNEKPEMLTEYLDGLVGRFFASVNKESITLISVPIVIWAALALLSTIERAFNNIWRVSRGRSFLHQMINYWALITLGPFLLGVGIFVSTQYAMVGQIHKTILSNVAPTLLSYLISVAAFFFLYFVLPNTKVQARAAVWGAAVAALVWSLAKYGFAQYVTEFIPYSKIYGVVGLVPLGVFWIYITWLIVLFGLQLTFTTQHLKSLDDAEIAAAKKSEDYFIANDFTAINIMREIAAAFEANNAPVSLQVICSKLGMPAEFGEKMLEHLVAKGLLMKTAEPKVGFVPSKVSCR